MSGARPRLTTHVLDTARGRPAAGVRVDLFAVDAHGRAELLATAVTDGDGRPEAPLLAADALQPGVYELAFHVGDYFRRAGLLETAPPFLDVVPVRFAIADEQGHYHVPLLVSPWSYTTYRGS